MLQTSWYASLNSSKQRETVMKFASEKIILNEAQIETPIEREYLNVGWTESVKIQKLLAETGSIKCLKTPSYLRRPLSLTPEV